MHCRFDSFQPVSCDVLSSIIHKLNRTTCGLDPFPTKFIDVSLIFYYQYILRIVNVCFSSGVFPVRNHFLFDLKNKVWILRF